MVHFRLVSSLLLAVALAASASNVQAQAVVPVRIFNSGFDFVPMSQSSYENFKHVGLVSQTGALNGGRAYGHFLRPDQLDLFMAPATYNVSLPPEQATPALFGFLERQPGDWWLPRTEFMHSAEACWVFDPKYPQDCYTRGCVFPRKSLTADFNADGKPDVFVACHGYDAPPFPGERNKVVLSQPDGTWFVRDAADDVGFFHGASSADLNGDQYPDVVVAVAQPFALINDGFGHFTREDPGLRFPAVLQGGYYSVELMDVDGNSLPDLVVGGHEHEAADTFVFLNPGDADFREVTPVVIPPVPGQGIVLDFTLTSAGGQRVLWVNRTSNPPPGEPGVYGVNAYTSRVVQKVAWPGLVASVPLLEDPGAWVEWLIPGVLPDGRHYVTPEIAVSGFVLIQ